MEDEKSGDGNCNKAKKKKLTIMMYDNDLDYDYLWSMTLYYLVHIQLNTCEVNITDNSK